jgi:hypothetical protein
LTRPTEQSDVTRALYDIFVDGGKYKSAGTYLAGVGTLLSPSGPAGIIKIHQYSISSQGTIAYMLNDSKPNGTMSDYGGYLNGGIVTSPNPSFVVKPFVPYPGYLCKTVNQGSALCLGTYVTAGALGTVYFQCVYTDSDTS